MSKDGRNENCEHPVCISHPDQVITTEHFRVAWPRTTEYGVANVGGLRSTTKCMDWANTQSDRSYMRPNSIPSRSIVPDIYFLPASSKHIALLWRHRYSGKVRCDAGELYDKAAAASTAAEDMSPDTVLKSLDKLWSDSVQSWPFDGQQLVTSCIVSAIVLPLISYVFPGLGLRQPTDAATQTSLGSAEGTTSHYYISA